MNAKFLIFAVAIVLVLALSADGFDVSAFDVTLIVVVFAIGLGIWFLVRGLGE